MVAIYLMLYYRWSLLQAGGISYAFENGRRKMSGRGKCPREETCGVETSRGEMFVSRSRCSSSEKLFIAWPCIIYLNVLGRC